MAVPHPSETNATEVTRADTVNAELSRPESSNHRVQITPEQVAHLAQLARLAVTPAELQLFAGQLEVILGAVARVGEVAAGADIPAMTHAVTMANVYRPDEVRPSLARADVLAGAPSIEDNKFRVPRILTEEA